MNVPLNKPIKLSILSSPAHLPVVRAAVEELCKEVGFSEDTTGKIILSLDEALSNIIKHAYLGKDDQPIEVELTPTGSDGPQGLQMLLRDYGRTVDRSEIKSRNLHEVRPGGLGVHIMTECMDEIDYTAAADGGTILSMIKKLPDKEDNR
ncbi:MAG: ATP-binding protein [Phycisphaerae bacterium]|nr:ATP-binding protein [Phycisphaerae bacterium]